MTERWVFVQTQPGEADRSPSQFFRNIFRHVPNNGFFTPPTTLDSSRFEKTWHHAPPFSKTILRIVGIACGSAIIMAIWWILHGEDLLFDTVLLLLIGTNIFLFLLLPIIRNHRISSVFFDRNSITLLDGSGSMTTIPWVYLCSCRFDTHTRTVDLYYNKSSYRIIADEDALMAICKRFFEISGRRPEFWDSTPQYD